MKKKRNILFAVPTNDKIEPKTVLKIAGICRRDDITYLAATGSPTDQLRNKYVRILLTNPDLTHLLMMDSDVIPPDNIVDLLLECLGDNGQGMAAGIVPIMMMNMVVTNIAIDDRFMTHWEDKKEPFDVQGAGTGIVLISRDVFETVPWPWFRYQEDRVTGSRQGEDMYFAKKAAGYGFNYRVHPKSVCGHIKKINLLDLVTAANVTAEQRQKQRQKQKQLQESTK